VEKSLESSVKIEYGGLISMTKKSVPGMPASRDTFRDMRQGESIVKIRYSRGGVSNGSQLRYGVFQEITEHEVVLDSGGTRMLRIHMTDIDSADPVDPSDIVEALNAFATAANKLLP
jgi:hypothetical protein